MRRPLIRTAVVTVLGAIAGLVAAMDLPAPHAASRCQAMPLHISALREISATFPGTLAADDPKVSKYFTSRDPRNFAAQLDQQQLDEAGALQGRHYGNGSSRLIVVADYNPQPGDYPGVTPPPDLDITVLDAATGGSYGFASLTPGCHD